MSVPAIRNLAPVLVVAALVVSGCSSSDDSANELLGNDAPLSGQASSDDEPTVAGPVVPDNSVAVPGNDADVPVEGDAPATDVPVGGVVVVPAADVPVGGEVPAADVPVGGDVPTADVPVAGEAPAADVPVAGEVPTADVPVAGEVPAADVPVAGEVPAADVPVGDSGSEFPAPSATGSGVVEVQDDSPTLTESLSTLVPFVRDPTRGAGPPSVPTGLTRLMAAENWVEFTWAPSSDDQSVEAYEIYRDGNLIETITFDSGYEHDYRSWLSTSFIDCNFTRYTRCEQPNVQPTPGGSYAYSVVAVDNEGMRSARSEEVVFSMATPGQSTVDLSGYQQVFGEEFTGTVLDRTSWKTSLPWGPDTTVNRELQYFVNTFGSEAVVSHDPFVFTGDTLQITGVNTPADELEAANGQPYLSGVISTADYVEMTYGYVEMNAKLSGGEGMLSTFYLFNQDFYKNKPEIDIIEYQGSLPDKAYQTYHYFDSNRTRDSRGEKHSSPTMETVTAENLSNDFHTYGVLWEPELVIWYIDGVEVRRIEGVRVADEPMHIVVQLVMGSEWIGTPDSSAIPAVVEIDYIRAWQK